MDITVVWCDAFKMTSRTSKLMNNDFFSLPNAAPLGNDEVDTSTDCASTCSSVSSVTVSDCCSQCSRDNEDIYDDAVGSLSRLRIYLPGQHCVEESSTSSTKSCPLNQRTAVSIQITIETLEADLKCLTRLYGKDDPLVACTWNLIGDALYQKQEFRRALAAYKEAVLCGDPGVHLAEAYFNLGRTYFALDNVKESIDFLMRSVQTHEYFADALGRDLSVSKHFADVQLQLGIGLTKAGSLPLATEALELAITIFKKVGICNEELAQTLNAMGVIALPKSDPQSALACHEEALELLQQQDQTLSSSLVDDTLSNIAVARQRQNCSPSSAAA